MDFSQMWDQISAAVIQYVPNVLGALLILIIGWFVALIISTVVKGVLRRTSLDNRIANWIAGDRGGQPMDIEGKVGKGVYYLIMLLVLVAFFQALRLTIITEPINNLLNEVFAYIPKLVGAGVLLLLAWLAATVLRFLVTKALGVARLDERLGIEEGSGASLATTLGNVVYWLVFLLFLPMILGALDLGGLLAPVQGMLDRFLVFLPNLLGATIILLVGWFVARLVQRISTNLLAAVGTDRLSERVGIASLLGETPLSAILGGVVYVLILIPVAIMALNALQLTAVTQPASEMLHLVLGALPAIFAALLVLVFSYVVGRVVATVVANFLAGVGFNHLLAYLHLGQEPEEGQTTPAEIVGKLVLVGILLFAAMEASSLLGFALLGALISQLLVFAGQVVLGLVILAIGIALANFVARMVESTRVVQSALLATLARVAILLLAGAMALQRMGLANEIIELAFGLVLGALAVAAAIAFGIGGRDFASRQIESWEENLKAKRK